jgi:transcriptional regulator with XRE-family HTH domain
MTLASLARRVRLSTGMISLIERGMKWPSVGARNRLEAALGGRRLWEALR